MSQVGQDAIGIYKNFKFDPTAPKVSKSAKPGNLQAIIDLCEEFKPKRVLELGGGMGTVTYALMKHSEAFVDVYEPFEFCRRELRKNLRGFDSRYNLIESYRVLPPWREYDLVIFDGGLADEHENKYEEVAWLFISYLRSVKVIFIEGRRPTQRSQARRALRSKGVFRVIRHKDAMVEGKRYAGGAEIRFIPLRNFVLRWANYLFWEFIIYLNYLRIKAAHMVTRAGR